MLGQKWTAVTPYVRRRIQNPLSARDILSDSPSYTRVWQNVRAAEQTAEVIHCVPSNPFGGLSSELANLTRVPNARCYSPSPYRGCDFGTLCQLAQCSGERERLPILVIRRSGKGHIQA